MDSFIYVCNRECVRKRKTVNAIAAQSGNNTVTLVLREKCFTEKPAL
jgi:hypothetical protein